MLRGLGCLLCILWKVACGLGCQQNTAKVAPADFRSGKSYKARRAEKEDSTSSRRQLNEGARGDFRDFRDED